VATLPFIPMHGRLMDAHDDLEAIPIQNILENPPRSVAKIHGIRSELISPYLLDVMAINDGKQHHPTRSV
jgi:hypothetical protein